MTLLEKFDSIVLSAEDQIPAEDLVFMQKEQKDFDDALQQLELKRQIFVGWYAEEENMGFTYYDERRLRFVSKPSTDRKKSDDETTNYYNAYKWSAAYGIYHCDNQLIEAKKAFITAIWNYFVKKYLLDLEEMKLEDKELDAFIKYKDILDIIKTRLGGILDFRGSAVASLIKDFKDEFTYKKPVLKDRILEINNFMWWNRNSDFEFGRFGGNNDKIELLDKAASVFETEEVKSNYAIMYIIGSKCTFDEYPPINGDKIESFRFFKNGKLQIKFKDSSLAKQFYNRFQLADV